MSRAAFLGPEGSFTHQATLKAFANDDTISLSVQPTFEDIFLSVQSGKAQYGVVPIENSSNGPVTQTLNLLGDRRGRYADLQVTGEIYLPVEHYLLGHRHASATDSERDDLSHITLIESHPQALGQCKAFLSQYCAHAHRRETSSTSQAAENAKADNKGRTAAIASRLCAELTGLDVLAAAIQDDSRNTTRFLTLQRSSDASPPPPPRGGSGRYKTLLVFTVSHSEPGALAKALAVFSKHDINLTGMHTAPLGEGMWQYSFFVEFEGQKVERGGEKGKVDEALEELEGSVRWMRWLGSWEGGGGGRGER